ncbi:stalk domain-containing protein [Cohnella candidum]|uniref:Copper amine oxidase-like N-terminal domain-containing protein n=1 Tax=Cohnella candidum TaxID=2674991 RepID=A0A3G3K1E5_9BACL|nr:hypothetical protein [Cohnella candidum]AYQ74242.1 hypothetical protein EAV92_17720 [Cohnella candidum]
MRKRIRTVLVLTAAGLLTVTAAAGASGLTSKVSGLLRKDVMVVVGGLDSGMVPVFIDGKAYLPAREVAQKFGYKITWVEEHKVVLLEDESTFFKDNGVITSVEQEGDGRVRFDFLGRSPNDANRRMIFHANAKSSVITDEEGRPAGLDALKPGVHVAVDYGPFVSASLPGSAFAQNIVVGTQRLIREDKLGDIRITDEGTSLILGTGEGNEFHTDLVLNAGKESTVISSKGDPLSWTDLKKGMRIRAYYGPAVSKSIPPQAPIDTIVVLDDVAPGK